MAITAFTSTAIIDATTIGTTVLTASSAGIAADAIGLGTTDDVTFNSVGGVDGDFSGTVTANTITSSGGNLTLQRNSSDSIIIGGAFIQCYQEVRPSITNTYSSGTATLRWSNTYSVGGSFSGNLVSETGGSYKLYQLGTEGDPDTQFFEFNTVGSDFYFRSQSTGAGVDRAIYLAAGDSPNIYLSSSDIRFFKAIRPQVTGTTSLGSVSYRWSNVASVDGDFSGTVNASNIQEPTGVGSISLTTDGGSLKRNADVAIGWGYNILRLKGNVEQWNGGAGNFTLGTSSVPWNNVYSVDGSFSGNLISETGGSYKLYDLGTEGDADTRYGEIYWSGNYLYFGSKTTGTGGGRDVGIARDGSPKIIFSTSTTTSYSRISPVSDGTISIGQTSKRWSNVYSVGGDFSGTVTMSGLPTSDPGVAGQLYTTTGGALKVSEG